MSVSFFVDSMMGIQQAQRYHCLTQEGHRERDIPFRSEMTLEVQRKDEKTNKELKKKLFNFVKELEKQLSPVCLQKLLSGQNNEILNSVISAGKPLQLQFDLSVSKNTFMVRKNLTQENRELNLIVNEIKEAFQQRPDVVDMVKVIGVNPTGDSMDDIAPWRTDLNQTTITTGQRKPSSGAVATSKSWQQDPAFPGPPQTQ